MASLAFISNEFILPDRRRSNDGVLELRIMGIMALDTGVGLLVNELLRVPLPGPLPVGTHGPVLVNQAMASFAELL